MVSKALLGTIGGGVTLAMLVALAISQGHKITSVCYCPVSNNTYAFDGGLNPSDNSIGYPSNTTKSGAVSCKKGSLKTSFICCSSADAKCLNTQTPRNCVRSPVSIDTQGNAWC